MSQIIVKNIGSSQSFFQDNKHHKKTSGLKWDANYNGKNANIKLDVYNNNKKKKYNIKLNKKDLSKILNHHTNDVPLDEQLKTDFLHVGKKGSQLNPELMENTIVQLIQPTQLLDQMKPKHNQHQFKPEPIFYEKKIEPIELPDFSSSFQNLPGFDNNFQNQNDFIPVIDLQNPTIQPKTRKKRKYRKIKHGIIENGIKTFKKIISGKRRKKTRKSRKSRKNIKYL